MNAKYPRIEVVGRTPDEGAASTASSGSSGMSLQEAIYRGLGGRGPFVPGPRPTTELDKIAIGMLALPAAAAGGTWALLSLANLYSVPALVYHFTKRKAATDILAGGFMRISAKGMWGPGVYFTSWALPVIARLQGARSTEAMITIATAGLPIRATPFPGTFRIPYSILF